MLARFRQLFRRWPAVCVTLALLAFASQGMAATLAWCVHDDTDNHVMNAVGPCHGAGDRERVGHDAAAHGQGVAATVDAGGEHRAHAAHDGLPCHDVVSHMAHVAADTDAASGASAALPAPAPALVSWSSPLLVAAPAFPHLATAGPLPARGDPRPRLSGARPGVSTRLLI